MTDCLDQKGLRVELMNGNGCTYAILLEPISFLFQGKSHTIPKGFVSDGASLPRFFWRMIGHPFSMDYLKEAVIHDWLYRYQPCTRAEADKFFYLLLKDNKLGFRRELIYWGLRIAGWSAWNTHKNKRMHLPE